MWDLIKIVIPKISPQWEDVAYALHFDIHTVLIIKYDHSKSNRCCKEVFKTWLSTDKGVSPKTWATLLNKLIEVDELRVAVEEIRQELFKQS